jgi:glutathione S-transferase
MELYGSYTSPYVRHCRIAVLEGNLDCTFIETDHAASAASSPTKRVPFLHDGAITLTDSASILMQFRRKAGQKFLEDPVEYDHFCLANTALDATVNLFMLERDGLTPDKSPYLARQAQRVASSLVQLNKLPLPAAPPYTDAELRIACYLAWGLFRQRISLAEYPNLVSFLDGASSYEPFRLTVPPQQ